MMASILMQRDLIATFKRETHLNIEILNKLYPVSSELYRYIFKDNGFEKPTQNQFNHLSHYLVSLIDPQVTTSLPWPLYDSKTERAYRNELSNFIADYSSKGLLTPIMSSYLVNPSCYKVTVLILELSELAIRRVLLGKMNKDRQKKLYDEATDKYKSKTDEGFIDYIESEIQVMLTKFSNYINKRRTKEKIAELFRTRISEMEAKLTETDGQGYIDNIVDTYISKHQPDTDVVKELLQIKNIKEPCNLFHMWLQEVDDATSQIESNWEKLSVPLLHSAKYASENSKALIGRHTGETDRSTFTLEYYHETDLICTRDLQCNVNSEQKYVLKNIVKENRLNFPNLVRSYIIAISYILRNNMIGDEIYKFNEYLDSGLQSYSEVSEAMKMVNERVLNVESKLQVVPVNINQSSFVEPIEIPPVPDLSNLKCQRDGHFWFETFTPLSSTKRYFNLGKKSNLNFAKPQSKSLLVTQFSIPRDNLFKTLSSNRANTFDRTVHSQDLHNISIISHINKANETIAECSSGFSKQQILRLFSSKKTSSSKKFKYKKDRPDISIKKGGLFNESFSSNESSGLFRSYSSPNLFENKERRPLVKGRARKLSIMKEDSPNSILEVSGIALLERKSNTNTPQGVEFEDVKVNKSNETISSQAELKDVGNIFSKTHFNLEKKLESSIGSEISQKGDNSTRNPELANTVTPKPNTQLVKKTSSLEKIINRYKKVRANILPSESFATPKNIKTIAEEKENNLNMVNVDVFTASKTLLPDLLSPNYNMVPKKNVNNFYDEFCMDINDESQPRRPRESLGTILGVDHTFLDQCDLID